jgi:hypothetical protein
MQPNSTADGFKFLKNKDLHGQENSMTQSMSFRKLDIPDKEK